MLTLKGCRAVDAAAAQLVVREAGGLVAFTGVRGSAGRAARPAPALAGRRGALEAALARARRRADDVTLPDWIGVIDWSLAGQVARGIAGLQPAGDPVPFEDAGRPGGGERAARVRVHRPRRRRRRCRSPRRSTAPEWIEANLRSLGGVLDPVADRIGGKLGPLGGAAGRAARRSRRARSPASSPAACSASTSSRCSIRRLPRGCCSWRRTSATPRTRSRPTRTSCCAGSRCTRPRTRSSSAACRGCASTSPTSSGELLSGARRRRARPAADARTSPTCGRCSNSCARTAWRSLAVGRERRAVLESAQAFMALLEGYAEHVMDAVGAEPARRPRRDARGDDPPAHASAPGSCGCSSA